MKNVLGKRKGSAKLDKAGFAKLLTSLVTDLREELDARLEFMFEDINKKIGGGSASKEGLRLLAERI